MMMRVKGLPRIFKRHRRFFIFAVIIVAVYLVFQMISIKLINRDVAAKDSKSSKTSVKLKHFHDIDSQIGNMIAPAKLKPSKLNNKSKIYVDELNESNDGVIGVALPKGVPSFLGRKFAPDAAGKFTCLTSGMKIAYSLVNDDYCDCDDQTDEPGTSACHNSRFYCTTQLQPTNQVWVYGSRVHDGICDCCDGSDEWAGHAVPHFMTHPVPRNNKKQPMLFYPCVDQCDESRQEIEESHKVKAMGARLKQEYIKAGLGKDVQTFGPEAVFYKLSEQCYTLDHAGFTYKVCPFSKISQTKQNSPEQYELGSHASWDRSKMADGVYELTMTEGSSMHCGGAHRSSVMVVISKMVAISKMDDGVYQLTMTQGSSMHGGGPGGAHRSSVIVFECDLQDQVTRVAELNRCHYSFLFTTPAAC